MTDKKTSHDTKCPFCDSAITTSIDRLTGAIKSTCPCGAVGYSTLDGWGRYTTEWTGEKK